MPNRLICASTNTTTACLETGLPPRNDAVTDDGPLEKLLLEYVDAVGGVWQDVEPQVYDVMLPASVTAQLDLPARDEMIRIAFDPEAVADYPDVHLMAFGNPLLDRVFEHAQSLGRSSRIYLTGHNLSPHDLPSLLRRGLQAPPRIDLHQRRKGAQHNSGRDRSVLRPGGAPPGRGLAACRHLRYPTVALSRCALPGSGTGVSTRPRGSDPQPGGGSFRTAV